MVRGEHAHSLFSHQPESLPHSQTELTNLRLRACLRHQAVKRDHIWRLPHKISSAAFSTLKVAEKLHNMFSEGNIRHATCQCVTKYQNLFLNSTVAWEKQKLKKKEESIVMGLRAWTWVHLPPPPRPGSVELLPHRSASTPVN